MSLSRRAFLGTGTCLLGLTGLGRVSAQAAQSSRLIWGINGHPFTAYPGIPYETQLDLVASLGMTQYRVNTRGDGSVEGLERLLPLARARGITILPILYPDVDIENDSTERLYDASFKLAADMAQRFEGRVPVWELANELESHAIIQPCEMRDDGTQYPCEWGPAGGMTPLEYYGPRWKKVSAVFAGLSEGVASTGTSARRAIGTAGWGHLGAFERMKADGIDWDITVWHDYEGITEPFLQRLASYERQIWITEFNAGGGGFDTEANNARRLIERMAYYHVMAPRYRIEAAFIYELLDETYWGDTFEARMGLIRIASEGDTWRVGEPKPAAAAVKSAISGVLSGR